MEDGKIDPSSPFYLGAGNQPGNLITHVVLKSYNYLPWSRAITLSLKSRRKFGFLDGTINKPAEKKKLLDWDTVNSMLVSWILRAIDPKIALLSLTSRRQRNYGTMKRDFVRLVAFLDREEEKLHQFLIGIDDDKYALVRTNLLSQQPPVNLDRAYQAFLQEERSRGIARDRAISDKSEAHIFALSSDRRSFQAAARVDKAKLYCSHCKRAGHDTTGCFMLHGPKARANAVAYPVEGSAMPSNDTLAALSEMQPEHIRLLLNMVNKQQQDKMTEFPFMHSNVASYDSSVDNGVDMEFLDDLEHVLDLHEVSMDQGTTNNSSLPPPSTPTAAVSGPEAAGSLDRSSAAAAPAHRSPAAAASSHHSPPVVPPARATVDSMGGNAGGTGLERKFPKL
uniref:Retrotransposon Copia-like N-terminal domain-containing protein n=1 Tax=Chenopodium quinoa TaxID=63459 RepID=A0A803KVU3_CHEQI